MPKNDDELLTFVSNTWHSTKNALTDLFSSTVKCYNLVRGELIDESQKSELRKRGLPYIPVNIVLPKILRLMAAERRIRADMKAIPLKGGVGDVADALTKIFRSITNQNDGLRERRDAKMDAAIGNLGGFIRVKWSQDNDILGEPNYERINPFFVFWDPKSMKYDWSDARYVGMSWWASSEDILRDWGDTPEMRSKIKKVLGIDKQQEAKSVPQFFRETVVTPIWEKIMGAKASKMDEFVNEKENLFRVIELEWREEKTVKRLFDPETQEVIEPDDDREMENLISVRQNSDFRNFIPVEVKKDIIWVTTTLGGNRLLLQNEMADVQNERFSIIPYWGYNFDGKPMGMVENLKGVQDEIWKARSAGVHILNMLANPKIKIPRGTLDPETLKKFLEHGNRTGFAFEYDETKGPPEIQSMQFPPTGMINRGEMAKQDAEEITGIGPNSVGRSDTSQESGELVKTRVAETIEMLQHLFDNYDRSDKLLFQYVIDMVQAKMTTERIINIISDKGAVSERMILNEQVGGKIKNDIGTGRYSVSADRGEAEHFRNEKFAKATAFMAVTPPEFQSVVFPRVLQKFDDFTDEEKETMLSEINALRQGQVLPEIKGLQDDILGQMNTNLQSVNAEANALEAQLQRQQQERQRIQGEIQR